MSTAPTVLEREETRTEEHPEKRYAHTYCAHCYPAALMEQQVSVAICGYVRKPGPFSPKFRPADLCVMCEETLPPGGSYMCPKCGHIVVLL